nr:retrovirus-related Pol polyprotein from transposon TNT 1-94 [Tanacetum cinerariifolium]
MRPAMATSIAHVGIDSKWFLEFFDCPGSRHGVEDLRELARDKEQHLAYELFGYREDSNEAAFVVAAVEKIYAYDMDARSDVYVLSNSCRKCSDNSNGYYWGYAPGEYIYLLLYVDDMLIACKSKAEIGSTKSLLKRKFEMKDLGEAKKILGMDIVRDRSHKILRVSQSEYISKILNNFRIDNGKSVQMPLGGHFKLSLKDCPIRDCDVERMSKVPYANAVGSLIIDNGKSVQRSLGGHFKLSLKDCLIRDCDVERMSKVSYENAVGSLMYLMVCTRPDIAYADVKEAIWRKGLLEELGVELNRVTVNCDNQGAIHLSRNHVFHERTKHINVRYHFIREVLEAKTVEVLKVGTEHNAADALTKVVPGYKLQHCLKLLSVGIG